MKPIIIFTLLSLTYASICLTNVNTPCYTEYVRCDSNQISIELAFVSSNGYVSFLAEDNYNASIPNLSVAYQTEYIGTLITDNDNTKGYRYKIIGYDPTSTTVTYIGNRSCIDKSSDKLAWYYILLIVLAILLVFGVILCVFKYRNRRSYSDMERALPMTVA